MKFERWKKLNVWWRGAIVGGLIGLVGHSILPWLGENSPSIFHSLDIYLLSLLPIIILLGFLGAVFNFFYQKIRLETIPFILRIIIKFIILTLASIVVLSILSIGYDFVNDGGSFICYNYYSGDVPCPFSQYILKDIKKTVTLSSLIGLIMIAPTSFFIVLIYETIKHMILKRGKKHATFIKK